MGANPKIIAIGGGKGGVGKSLVSAGIATEIAKSGSSTVCVDLDLGGANLHTFFGLRTTKIGIGDFLYKPHSRNLEDYTTDTGIENLKLISGTGFIPGIANLYYFQKLKILRAVGRLNFDYVILDLGAGTSYNVIDFFSLTRSGIVVTNPEPTAILNAYEFIKNVLYRIFSRNFKQGDIALETIEAHKFGQNQEQGSSVRELVESLERIDPEAAITIKKICNQFRPFLVLNMVKSKEHAKALAVNLIDICKNFLDIQLGYLGSIPTDGTVAKELTRLNNIFSSSPESKAAKAISKIASSCLKGFSDLEITIDPAAEEQEIDKKEKRSEGLELANMIERFFSELKGTITSDDAPDDHDLSPLTILEPQLIISQEHLRPIFIKEDEDELENLAVPGKVNELLAFIVDLSDLEEEIKINGKSHTLDVTLNEISKAWFKTGCRLAKSGQYATAVRSFKRGLNLEPDNWKGLNNMAACMIILGRLKEAKERLIKASSFTSDITLTFNKALIEFLSGNYDRCLKLTDKNYDESKIGERFSALRAYSLFYLNRFKESLKAFNNLSGYEKEYNCALVNLLMGDEQNSLCNIKNFLRVDKTNPNGLAIMAINLFKKGQRQDAISVLEKAISHSPADIKIRALTAYFSYQEGLLDKAIKEAEVITRLRPSNPNLLHFVSELRSLLG